MRLWDFDGGSANMDGRVVKMLILKVASDMASAEPASWFLTSDNYPK